MVVTSGHCQVWAVSPNLPAYDPWMSWLLKAALPALPITAGIPGFLRSVNRVTTFPSPLNVCVNPFFPLSHRGNYSNIIIRSKPTDAHPNQTTAVCVRQLVLRSNPTEKPSLALLPKESGHPTQVWCEVKITYHLTHELFILPHKQIN